MVDVGQVINGVPFKHPLTGKTVEVDGITVRDALFLKNLERIADEIARLKS